MSTPLIIDTREPTEYAMSHIDGAINISSTEFMDGSFRKKLGDVAKDTPIIVYCITGARSNTCGHFLRAAGYTNITNGINEQQVRARFLHSKHN